MQIKNCSAFKSYRFDVSGDIFTVVRVYEDRLLLRLITGYYAGSILVISDNDTLSKTPVSLIDLNKSI